MRFSHSEIFGRFAEERNDRLASVVEHSRRPSKKPSIKRSAPHPHLSSAPQGGFRRMAGDDVKSLYDDRPRFGVVPHPTHTCPRPGPRETPRPDCPLSGPEETLLGLGSWASASLGRVSRPRLAVHCLEKAVTKLLLRNAGDAKLGSSEPLPLCAAPRPLGGHRVSVCHTAQARP